MTDASPAARAHAPGPGPDRRPALVPHPDLEAAELRALDPPVSAPSPTPSPAAPPAAEPVDEGPRRLAFGGSDLSGRARRSDVRAYVAVVAGGTVVTGVASLLLGAPAGDALVLVALAVAGALVVGVAGGLLGLRLRTKPLAAQVALVAVTAVAASLVGALLAARAMFVSPHDLEALLVVLAAGGTAAATVGLVLGARLGRASDAVAQLSTHLARGAAPIPATDGLPAELADVADQLTDTWARLGEARGREAAMEASRRELVAWVSHDLRIPLAGIRTLAAELEAGTVTDPAALAGSHAAIRQEADRLARLVDDLLELSRIQADTTAFDPERVGLADVVADALAAGRAGAEGRGVVLEGDVLDPDLEVAASSPDLARAVHVLLDHAIAHTPRGGRVQVVAAAEGEHVVLAVVDSCGGLPAAAPDQVFDLAFGGDGTPGLAVARELVASHHGTLDVAAGQDGCRATVRLPRRP